MEILLAAGPFFAVLIAWSVTSTLFIVIPIAVTLGRDVRAAEAAGIPNAKAVARRRFFLPATMRPLHASLLDRVVWIERSRYPAHDKRALRVTAVRAASLQFDDGSTFEPRRMSRHFADGTGAATGVMRDPHGSDPVLVVFT